MTELEIVCVATLFKEMLVSLGPLDEVPMKVTEEGISITSMGDGNVFLVSLNIPKECFAEFKYPSKTEKIYGFSKGDILKFMGSVKEEDILQVEFKESKMILKIMGKSKRRYVSSLLDLTGHNKIPSTDLCDTRVEIDSKFLKEDMAIAGLLGDVVVDLSIDADGNFCVSAGKDNGSEIECIHEKEVTKIEANSQVKSSYQHKTLSNLIKLCKEECKIYFGKDIPVFITYFLADQAKVMYVLAPRVEN